MAYHHCYCLLITGKTVGLMLPFSAKNCSGTGEGGGTSVITLKLLSTLLHCYLFCFVFQLHFSYTFHKDGFVVCFVALHIYILFLSIGVFFFSDYILCFCYSLCVFLFCFLSRYLCSIFCGWLLQLLEGGKKALKALELHIIIHTS